MKEKQKTLNKTAIRTICEKLFKLGYATRQINQLLRQPLSWKIIQTVSVLHEPLMQLGFDHADILGMAVRKEGSDVLEIVLKKTEKLKEIGFPNKRITMIAAKNSCSIEAALDAIIKNAGILKNKGVSEEDIAYIACKYSIINTFEKVINDSNMLSSLLTEKDLIDKEKPFSQEKFTLFASSNHKKTADEIMEEAESLFEDLPHITTLLLELDSLQADSIIEESAIHLDPTLRSTF